MSGFIQKVFTSRDNNANSANYVGEQDRIWWNPDTNAFYYSDGSTPGGQPVGIAGNASIAGTNTQVQFNRAGSFGASSAFTYDYANSVLSVPSVKFPDSTVQTTAYTITPANLTIGNLYIGNDSVYDIVSNNSITIGTSGSNAGIIFETDDFSIKTTTNPNPVFQVNSSGEVLVLSPTFNANTGAISIVGSSDGSYVAPAQAGGMLHVTGQPSTASRVFNDAANNYALYAGRRYNGTSAAPTQVLANDVIARFSAGAYNSGNVFPTTGVARFDIISLENQTPTNQGSRIEVWVTPIGSNVITKQLVFSSNGITFIDGTSQNTAAIPLNYLANANGVATLGPDGKVLSSQLSAGAVIYKGTWNASTNTPTLGPGLPSGVTAGWQYSVSVGGTQDIGDGSVTFYPGDYVTYNGSTWDRIPGSGSVVASFNTRTGAVTLSSSDVTTALGYTPYNGSTNPNGYVNTAGAAAAAPVQSFNTRTGAVTLQSSDVTTALTSGSLTNAKLANSNVIIGNTTVSLGSTANTLTGLTGVTATTFTGNLSGAATTAGTVTTAAQPNITSVGNLTALTVTGNTSTGNLNITANGVISTPRLVFNDGGINTVVGGTSLTVDFSVHSLVFMSVPTGTVTVALQNYTAGAEVKVIFKFLTAYNIAMGVANANNSTTGTTTLTGTGPGSNFKNNQTVALTYTCVDGTAANTFVQASYS